MLEQDYHDLGERYPQAPVPKLFQTDTLIHRANLGRYYRDSDDNGLDSRWRHCNS